MPTLYEAGRALHHYPVGLSQSDFAMLAITPAPDGSVRYGGALSYLGPVAAKG